MKKKLTVVLLVCMTVLFAGCNGDGDPKEGPRFVAVTDITGVLLTVAATEENTLTGRVEPDNATNKTITWSVKSAGTTGAVITGNKLKATAAGSITVTATVAKGRSGGSFTKDFPITVTAVDALVKTFDVVTTGGTNPNMSTGAGNIIGNSLAWVKDAKPGSVLKFIASSTVYPTGNAQQPQIGSTIAVIGNPPAEVFNITIPDTATPGTGRQVIVDIPIAKVLEMMGTSEFLTVSVQYGRINACELWEPRIYQVPLTGNAKRLMNYFIDIYGEKIISGQMDTSWSADKQYDQLPVVFEATGKYPALKGFDFIQNRVAFNGTDADLGQQTNPTMRQQTLEALDWWNGKDQKDLVPYKLFPERDDLHGIVVFCWHWRGADNGYYGNDDSPKTTLRIPMTEGKLNKAHANFTYIKGEIDKAIVELKRLQEEGVPVLWRPLHEALGNTGLGPWFWWGVPPTVPEGETAYSRDSFKLLWEYMYDYMTIVHGLDNLIWLLNGQGATDNMWVSNLKTFHLTGYDRYPGANVDDSQKLYFDYTKNIDPTKLVTLSENGPIPNPDKCMADDAMWLFFMVWDRMFTNQNGTGPGSIGHTAYNHEKVITFDKLPDLTKYRLE
jgi:hypothetical protein